MTSLQTRNSFVQAYLNANHALIDGLVVKFRYAAIAINRDIRKLYGDEAVRDDQPDTWKYYMNVAGEYHFSDVPMKVISLDTREEILFSKENLALHTATAVGYRRGGRYFRRLVLEYPNQEFLIGCILSPAVKERAIAAEDGEILSYPSYLVEEHESTLIYELSTQIKQIQRRWNVQAFALSDEYYAAMQAAILSLSLRPILLNLRERRRKTDEVHSFHLREYLASHQRLDRFLPYLTREQALWVYRNIRYIVRNAGKVGTFELLLDNLLNKRMIPLAEYVIHQGTSFDNLGYPLTQAYRNTISKANMAGDIEYIDLEGLYNKEKKTADGNTRFFELEEARTTHQLKTANSSVLQTKDLESAMIDLSNMVPDPLPTVLVRQWVAMTHQGLYNAVIHFQDPLTAEQHSLLSKDAIIYLYYLVCRSQNIPADTLPLVATVKYRKHPRPPVEELLALIEPGMRSLRSVAHDLVQAQPIFTQIHSVSHFQSVAREVYDECLRHYYMLADRHDVLERGVLEQMTLKLFGHSLFDFSDGEPLEVWRVRNSLPPYTYTYEQAQSLIQEIFTRATGYQVDDTRSLRNIQRALIEMFAQLSSYSVQFIRDINDNDILMGGAPHTRYGDVREHSESRVRWLHQTSFYDPRGRGQDQVSVDLGSGQLVESRLFQDEYHGDFIHTWNAQAEDPKLLPLRVTAPVLSLSCAIQTADPLTGELAWFPADRPEQFLTEAQFQDLKFYKDF
jgi:hypothetical protein